MRRREKVSSAKADEAVFPRIVRATRFSLRALVRMPRMLANASLSSSRRSAVGLPISGSPRLLVASMAIECARRREFPELVADHVLGDQHRDEFVTIVDPKGQPDELRKNRRPARPGADYLVAPRAPRLVGLLQKIAVDEWAFPN